MTRPGAPAGPRAWLRDGLPAARSREGGGTRQHRAAASTGDPPARSEEVRPAAGAVRLAGSLAVPDNPRGIVVFAHGSGSSRHSPRNRHVAGILNDAGLGTLLFDLLTPEEELHRANVFGIGLLARRLADVTGWLRAQPGAAPAAIGYFGASTGAAAALRAAAEPRHRHRGRGVPQRPPRPCPPPARRRDRTHTAHCRRA
jgi:putative phosphoribosyl transferase